MTIKPPRIQYIFNFKLNNIIFSVISKRFSYIGDEIILRHNNQYIIISSYHIRIQTHVSSR